MRLPQFLHTVDEQADQMTIETLKLFIHEIARQLSEDKREEFIALMSETNDENKSVAMRNNEDHEITEQIDRIIKKLESIDDGDVYLEADINEEYDDWYNPDVNEFVYNDPSGLLVDINEAIALLHKCVDHNLYEEGNRLCDVLCPLDVVVVSEYGLEPMDMEALCMNKLLLCNYRSYMNECLYLAYMGHPLDERPEALYHLCFIFDHGARLEDVLQIGHELPEFDEFLILWINYLGHQSGKCADRLLEEAQSLISDQSTMVDNVKKYGADHPQLYVTFLGDNVTRDPKEMLEIGLEALDQVPVDEILRSDIALLTANYADKLSNDKIKEHCWLEAFKSDMTTLNYLRLKFLSQNFTPYREEVRQLLSDEYRKMAKGKLDSFSKTERLSFQDYCTILFFEQEFEQMKDVGMSVTEGLGWSWTFMKQGLALLMVMLHQGESYQSGMHAMLRNAMSACSFNKDSFYFGTNIQDERSGSEIFKDILEKWKKTVHLTQEEKDMWMNQIAQWIDLRVGEIVGGTKRNYYNECAAFIAAYGEVKESMGHKEARLGYMDFYHRQYPRHSAFYAELKEYGLR